VPWIPCDAELKSCREEWVKIVPKDVQVIVTHTMTETEVLKTGDTSLPGRIIALENAVKQLNDKRENNAIPE
jgi:hypothetical protein